MSKSTRVRLIVLLVVVSAVLTAVVLISRSPVNASQPKTWQRSIEGLSYEGFVDPSGIVSAQISLPKNTAQNLEKYAAANRSLALQLWKTGQSTLEVQVTLKHPISVDALAEIQSRTGMTLAEVQARIIGADGRRNTADWIVTSPLSLGSPLVDRAVADIAQKTKGEAKFLGVVSFSGKVTQQTYNLLISQADVFLVDVMSNQILQEAEAIAPGYKNARDQKFILYGIYGRPGFWDMEDIGLQNFQ